MLCDEKYKDTNIAPITGTMRRVPRTELKYPRNFQNFQQQPRKHEEKTVQCFNCKQMGPYQSNYPKRRNEC